MLCATLTLAIALDLAAAGQLSDATRALTQLEQQLAATWKNGDCAAWSGMVAPEWSVIHITGEVITRAQALEMCGAPGAKVEVFEIDEISVRPFGGTAVVTGRTRIVTSGANAGQVTLRFTDVFVRRGGRWLVVASHATRIGT